MKRLLDANNQSFEIAQHAMVKNQTKSPTVAAVIQEHIDLLVRPSVGTVHTAQLAKLWFATLLRDGFALTAAGGNGTFAEIGAEALRGILVGAGIDTDPERAVEHVMAGMAALSLHADVPGSMRALRAAGYRLVTVTNGSAVVAEKLFVPAGIQDQFDHLLSVEDAPGWKPAGSAYDYAATVCGVRPGLMLLVAVHPWDIHGAAQAGFGTAWLNRTGERYPRYFAAPDYTVASLDELSDAIKRRGV